MRFFTCLLDPEGRGISADVRRAYEVLPRARKLEFRWHFVAGAAVLTCWDDPYGDPLLVDKEDWVAVGMVRLDNRSDLERWAGCSKATVTDLELVLQVITRHGTRYVSEILGDFAFVAWHNDTRSAIAACDAFAVHKMYYAERQGLIAFASRAEALALDERYDVGYLAAIVSLHDRPRDLSVYAGTRPIPPASLATIERRRLHIQQYWQASEFEMQPSWAKSQDQATQTCRQLLAESIRQRMKCDGGVWAQLSGGIDSSSVVSLTQWLAERGELPSGLAGTVTFVDRQATGTDEREYSDAVASRWKVRNELVVDPPMWYDEQYDPPLTDQPRGDVHIYPRDSRLRDIVRQAGGRVLLTGVGGDELFTANMLFFADWIVRGRVWPAVKEMARRAAIGRVSFWALAYRNALLPLFPRMLHSSLVHDQDEVPVLRWLEPVTMRQYEFTRRPSSAAAYGGRVGHHYHDAVVASIAKLESPSHGGVIADSLDVRHPLLYRPLVEFALQLPPELSTRPHAHRWVVREALRGILPETLRTRVGKPGTADVLTWSLSAHQARLRPLLHDPILGDLGIVNPTWLRAAFVAALAHEHAAVALYAPLLATLGVEAWLQLRSGRWPRSSHQSNSN